MVLTIFLLKSLESGGIFYSMKRLFLAITVLMFVAPVFAGPFGLSSGMTYNEVAEASVGNKIEKVRGEEDAYTITPKKSHSVFKTYIVRIDDKYGLYYVKAQTDSIEVNKYGKELKEVFYDFEPRLEKSYGKPELFDDLIDKYSYLSGEDDWTHALKEGARELYAKWQPAENGAVLKDDIIYVKLWVESNYSYGNMYLEYYFDNTDDVNSKEDEYL